MADNEFLQINPADFKVLVVDDVPANVMLLRVMLTRSGYKVITCGEPLKVVDLVNTEMPDLILLDVMMPQLSGFQICQILKGQAETKDIPIIFLTALDNTESMLEGFRAGAADYIGKPFEKDILLERVRSQIQLVAARQIIERQNIELRETIYGRDKLYSVIAHDLRSPLGAIQVTIKMFEDMHGLIVECNNQVTELFSLLDNLLKWTKSQTGKLKTVFQDFALNIMIEAVYDMYRKVAEMKGITLTIEGADSSIIVHADMDMCKTVLRNFLSNAIKFSNKGSSIEIVERVDGDFAVMSVRDHGCGMTEEEVGRLFNKDTHFSKFGTNREEGSGLGLLLCQSFAMANGGRLEVQSKQGEGSTFSMYIPLNKG